MAGALLRGVRRFPWLGNVLLYGGLFAAGDAAQQRLRGQPPDWAQTRRVALVALAFHGNFSYVWLRALERALPGRRPPAVLGKVLCDQLLGAPVAVLAFYTGMSILQRKEDIFSDCRKKFWNTYKAKTSEDEALHSQQELFQHVWCSIHGVSLGSTADREESECPDVS
ncbi:Mpv17-like protein [Turdus rufiventris]|nr:Mpv17-like protein [Turdus rufiventris]